MLFLLDLSLVCSIVFILLLWNCSSIVETFAKYTHTGKLFHIEQFYEHRRMWDNSISYRNFLYEHKPCFITELLSCNICFTFWLNVLLFPIVLFVFPHENLISNIYLFPVNYIGSLLLLLILKNLYNSQTD